MKQLKFKVSKAQSIGSSLSVNIQPRKWYIAWLWVKVIVKHLATLIVPEK